MVDGETRTGHTIYCTEATGVVLGATDTALEPTDTGGRLNTTLEPLDTDEALHSILDTHRGALNKRWKKVPQVLPDFDGEPHTILKDNQLGILHITLEPPERIHTALEYTLDWILDTGVTGYKGST